jgi:hypothetical protein
VGREGGHGGVIHALSRPLLTLSGAQQEAEAEQQRKWEGSAHGQILPKKEYEP